MLSPSQQVQIFLAIQLLGGHIGLPLLIITFFFMKKSRSIVVTQFCVSWVIFSVSFSLLMYRTTPLKAESSQGLCLLSEAMTNGAVVMTSLSTLTFLLNLWFSILRPSWYVNEDSRHNVEFSLAYSPYIAFLAPFFVTYALSAPSDGQQGDNTFGQDYCINSGDMWIPVYLISIAILGLATILDAIVLWSVFRRAKAEPALEIKYLRRMIIKLSLFSAYRIVSTILVLLVMVDGMESDTTSLSFANLEYSLSVLQTGAPLVAFLMLCTRSDVLQTWRSWLSFRSRRSSMYSFEDSELPIKSDPSYPSYPTEYPNSETLYDRNHNQPSFATPSESSKGTQMAGSPRSDGASTQFLDIRRQ